MKSTTKKYLLSFSILSCLVIGAVLAKPVISWLYPATVSSSVGALYLARDIAEYSKQANAIIIGEVGKVSDPYLVEGGTLSQQDVTMNIEEVLKGDPDMKNIKILIQGGSEVVRSEGNDVSFIPESENIYKPGEKILLFIGRTTEGANVPFAGPYGKYLIDENNNVSSIGDFQISLEKLKAQIQEALKSSLNEETPSHTPTTFSFTGNLYIARDIPLYTETATAIIIGKVTNVSDRKVINNNVNRYYQDIAIDVEQTLKGDPNLTKMTLVVEAQPKFTKGSTTFSVEGEVKFSSGEKVLLFAGKDLEGNDISLAGPHSKFLIDENSNVSTLDGYSGSLERLKTEIQEALKLPPKEHVVIPLEEMY